MDLVLQMLLEEASKTVKLTEGTSLSSNENSDAALLNGSVGVQLISAMIVTQGRIKAIMLPKRSCQNYLSVKAKGSAH